MPKFSNVTGVVIKMHNAKDADKVVHILAESGERMVLFAKGIKKSKSRKAHAVDLLNLVQFKLVQGNGNLQTIAEAKLIKDPKYLRQSLTGLLAIQAVCEVVDQFIQEDSPEAGYYNNLRNLVDSLTEGSESRMPQLLAALILRCLYISGDLPKLNEDIRTGEQLDEDKPRYLSADIGYSPVGTESVPDRIFKTQRFILKQDFAKIASVLLTQEEQLQIMQIHVGWLKAFLQKDLPAINLFTAQLIS